MLENLSKKPITQWNPEEGDSVCGLFMGVEPFRFILYNFGGEVIAIEYSSWLRIVMRELKVSIGDTVHLTYLGIMPDDAGMPCPQYRILVSR